MWTADGLDQVSQKPRCPRTIHYTMVARKRQGHHGTNARTSIRAGTDWHNSVGDGSDCKNGGLGRNDDRGKRVHTEHAEIADREGAARDIARTQLAATRAFRKVPPLHRDLTQRGFVSILNHRRYHA